MKVGIIGTGTMGSLLVQSFVQANALTAESIILFNRSAEKAQQLAERMEGVTIAHDARALVAASDIIFLCIKPHDYATVLEMCQTSFRAEQIVVTITSPVMIDQLEALVPAKVAKLIPSVTNSLQSGVALYCFGERLDNSDRSRLLQLFRALGLPLEIQERHTRIASDISSCGPAFLSALLQLWIQAAVDKTGISTTLAQQMMAEMLSGLAQLLTCGGVTPHEIITKVAVPGGITAAGLECLLTECEGLFESLTTLTQQKFNSDCLQVEKQLAIVSQPRC